MNDFNSGDRVVVLRLDSDDIECHGSYAGESGPIVFVWPDDDELPDPIEVGADRVFPEKRRAQLATPDPAADRLLSTAGPALRGAL